MLTDRIARLGVAPLTVVCLMLMTGGGAHAARPADNSPAAPNIVLIISDDQAWTDYGFMGHEVIETPQLDRLARESVVFRRGYVPTALCRPSLLTLVTGQYAQSRCNRQRSVAPRCGTRFSNCIGSAALS